MQGGGLGIFKLMFVALGYVLSGVPIRLTSSTSFPEDEVGVWQPCHLLYISTN